MSSGDPTLDAIVASITATEAQLAAEVAGLQAYQIPGQPPNGGGNGGGGEVFVPRAVAPYRPYEGGNHRTVPCYPHLMPLGDQVKYDPRPFPNSGGYYNFNTLYYGLSIGTYPPPPKDLAGGAFIMQKDNVENHVALVDVAGHRGYNYYRYGLSNQQMSGSDDLLLGLVVNVNMGASALPHLAGVVRIWDTKDGGTTKDPFGHALHLGMPGSALSVLGQTHGGRPGPGCCWPAYRIDGNSSFYGKGGPIPGFVRIGERVGIPAGSAMPAGLTPGGQRAYLTLVMLGGIVHDTGAAMFGEAGLGGYITSGDTAKLFPLLRVVTNDVKPAIGGQMPLGDPAVSGYGCKGVRLTKGRHGFDADGYTPRFQPLAA